MKNNIDFVVIGAMKCGTTSLYTYLQQHGDIDLCKVKELNFFNNYNNWKSGVKWYHSYYANDGRIRGDVNPNYAMYPTCCEVPLRLHEFSPSAKLIYLIRDPVKRSISHILHNIAERKESRSFQEIIDELKSGNDDKGYLAYSNYSMQIEQFLKFFSLDSILIIDSNDLRANQRNVLNSIREFVGLSPLQNEFHENVGEIHSTERKRIKPSILRALSHNHITGKYLHATVLSMKRILPSSIYEFFREFITLKPKKILIDDVNIRLLENIINNFEKIDNIHKKGSSRNLVDERRGNGVNR